ncbi:MAG: PAS domain S-box protein [Clostridiales bacterium]|nr:PAS domain S-box protein [Clostridiales bacterium]
MEKKKILIIGDDLVSARDTVKMLRDIGYPVIALVALGKKALSIIKKKQPHLVLVNGRLRGKRAGMELARRILEELELPVLILVDRSEFRAIKPTIGKLGCGCLLKPVDKQNIEMAIETTLARHVLEKKIKDRAKKALLESEERYFQLVDNISEGVVIQDKKGIITSANERFLELIGYKRKEVLGRPITAFLGEGWLKKEEGLPEDRWRSIELAWKRKDGKRIYTILSRRPIHDPKGRFEGYVSVLTDITERRQVELELRRSQEELRSLSQHLQSIRESESKRIAGEIHDILGQQLTALKIDLSWLSSRAAGLGESGQEIQNKISAMADLVDKTIQSVQKISAELRPVLLDDLGLGPAIEWLAQDFENRTKIKCRVRLACDTLDLDPDCSTAIFRISQEALTNVARHARATAVDIHLAEENGELLLKIGDNGKGIKENEVHAPTSLGLMGMRERIRPFGGKLEITGSPEKGTLLTVAVPLERGRKRGSEKSK